MTKVTAQGIFDTVVAHLYKQGRPSVYHGECLYRGPNGLKCAVGILISDKRYRESCELNRPRYLIADGILPKYYKPFEDLLYGLQCAHDYCDVTIKGKFSKVDLAMRLREVARVNGLSFKQPVSA